MKSTIAYTGLLSACSILVALFLPWWVLMLLSFVLAFYFRPSEGKAFGIAFATTSVLWSGMVFWLDQWSQSPLSAMVGQVFRGLQPSHLYWITGLVGGITAGLSAWAGSAIGLLLFEKK
ncbi:MAG: hypothetical protein WBP33_10190 [Saprospiraceae bacterium]|nr:hypothetical protein [Candidatus Vicinibacter proximus]MCC6842296.1 hypothetical protein [Saprospiraceae bacterium]HRG33754.1 hypothetical protein [Saprospiraceae bacterium]